jgi:deoxyribodipyrimidine photo-lyase
MDNCIFWFRRDLRLDDNAGLYRALKSGMKVIPIFIFDKHILDKLDDKKDLRVKYIHDAILNLQKEFAKYNCNLQVFYGEPSKIIEKLITTYSLKAIYTNHDYEPYAKQRDEAIEKLLKQNNATLFTYKDQCIFEKSEVVKDDGLPYTVFTPYSKKWKLKLTDYYIKPYPVLKYINALHKGLANEPIPTLANMGFENIETNFPKNFVEDNIIQNYHDTRDIPSKLGTSRLSVHLRFGTISIRKLAKQAIALNEKYLNELIWRDFYMQILWHFPHVVKGSFRPVYDEINWRNNEQEFEAWCQGNTGYPIVDAGMRELNTTGWMHNRVRMIVASFLTKHLLIDWRWGEAYFAKKLIDFDLSANNGGWQWAAGSGVDAAPYFRVFNPALQTDKFDKQLVYIRKWIPELDSFDYPKPIIQHELARKRCLEVYAATLKKVE